MGLTLKEPRGGDEVGVDRDGDDHDVDDDVDDSIELFIVEGCSAVSVPTEVSATAVAAAICSDRSDNFRNRSANSPVNSPMVTYDGK